MNQWQLLSLAISIVAQAFEGKTDRAGKPYILHCLYVMNKVSFFDDPELMQIAVMHDLLEDCPEWTAERLRLEGFSERVINGLVAMTHLPGEDYITVYIARIALNSDAVKVKKADLKHNSCVTRSKGVRPKDLERLDKYARAYQILSEI